MVLGTFRDKRGTLDSTRNGRAGDGDGGDDEDKLVGWLYVGSHNFTPSAWGTLSGTSFSPSLNVSPHRSPAAVRVSHAPVSGQQLRARDPHPPPDPGGGREDDVLGAPAEEVRPRAGRAVGALLLCLLA